MAGLSRDALVAEYKRLYSEMETVGLDPVVGCAVLEVFTEAELRALIKDSAFRLLRFRRLEQEL